MAGHSHWSKIKRAKGATDAKRGKVWSKIARKIIIAAKNGGDPRDNLSLRYVIEEASRRREEELHVERASGRDDEGKHLQQEQEETLVEVRNRPPGAQRDRRTGRPAPRLASIPDGAAPRVTRYLALTAV